MKNVFTAIEVFPSSFQESGKAITSFNAEKNNYCLLNTTEN
ncbi:hypothetical protein [Treponema phagedenis]|nr:hypothetical protein [Treponema phagedenis]